MEDESKDSERDVEPEIAADDAGASAAAERLQKEREADNAETNQNSTAGSVTRSRSAARETNASDDDGNELLIDGQEEVFSRSEVESGRIEHHIGEASPPRASELEKK